MKYFIIALALFVAGCNQCTYPIDMCAKSTESFKKLGASQAPLDQAINECKVDFESKKLKNHFAKNKCITNAMKESSGPYFLNQAAFHDYTTNRLLLAIRLDKKQVTQEEADVILEDLGNKLVAAENSARQADKQAAVQNSFSTFLLQNSMNSQRTLSDQNSHNTRCSTTFGVTSCNY